MVETDVWIRDQTISETGSSFSLFERSTTISMESLNRWRYWIRGQIVWAVILLIGCVPSKYYKVQTPLTSRVEIVGFYERVNGDPPGFVPEPAFVEVVVDEHKFRFHTDKYEVLGAVELDRDVFLLARGNFGLFLTRLCKDGEVEFVGDFSELSRVTSEKDFSVEAVGSDLLGTVKYSYIAGYEVDKQSADLSVSKLFQKSQLFSGCRPVLSSAETKSGGNLEPEMRNETTEPLK